MSRPDPSIVPVPALDASTPAQRWHTALALVLGLLGFLTSLVIARFVERRGS